MPHACRVVALTLLLLLVGCSAMPIQHEGPRLADTHCKAKERCNVEVTIEAKGTDCVFLCNPIAPEKTFIDNSINAAGDKIVWTLRKGARARFVSGGIEFDNPDAPFKCSATDGEGNGASNDRKQWTCTSLGDKRLGGEKPGDKSNSYKYVVRLRNEDSFSWNLDPFVVNR